MTDYNTNVWTDPFTPNDEIGCRTGKKVHKCKDCGLQTMVGTTDEIVHKRGCTHRGN
jgi:hypothetical protein